MKVEIIQPAKKLPVWLLAFITASFGIAYAITRQWPLALLAFIVYVIAIFVFYFINKWQVEIDDEKITIKAPFYSRTYFWKDITITFITSKLSYNIGHVYWYFDSSSEIRSGFNVNYFSKKQLRRIAAIVIEKCPDLKVDIIIANIAEGKFPWYIF